MNRYFLYGTTIVLCLLHIVLIIVFETSRPTWICHDALRCCMKDVHDLCIEEGIQYWIQGGTLLGSVRNGDIIPFDDDIDICVHAVDIDRLSYECRKRGMEWTFVYDGLYRITKNDPQVFIDVFPVETKVDSLVYMGMARLLFKESYHVTDTFSTKYNLGRIRLGDTFMPLVLNGPDDAEAYLNSTYGPGWCTPKMTHAHTLRGIRDSYVYAFVLGAIPLILLILFSFSVFQIEPPCISPRREKTAKEIHR